MRETNGEMETGNVVRIDKWAFAIMEQQERLQGFLLILVLHQVEIGKRSHIMKAFIFILFSVLLLPNFLFAANETGTVSFDQGQYASGPSSAGYTFFWLEGTKDNPPACATAHNGERWVISNNWPAAKIQISILLTAIATGREVLVRGSGDCAVWGDSETAVDIILR